MTESPGSLVAEPRHNRPTALRPFPDRGQRHNKTHETRPIRRRPFPRATICGRDQLTQHSSLTTLVEPTKHASAYERALFRLQAAIAGRFRETAQCTGYRLWYVTEVLDVSQLRPSIRGHVRFFGRLRGNEALQIWVFSRGSEQRQTSRHTPFVRYPPSTTPKPVLQSSQNAHKRECYQASPTWRFSTMSSRVQSPPPSSRCGLPPR